jgi:hypothetical protein
MSGHRVELARVEDGGGTRSAWARLTANGDLVIAGQDLSAGVEAVFGSDEYEWGFTVAKAEVPRLLGGARRRSRR